ncbi:MAG: hypothetical protein MUO42_02745 [Anaerolineaceae bacterium]|nr:hypothetical protein [Anaerolineaceae bacterium]
MNTGFQLYQLQEIDTTIDKANRRLKEIEISLMDNTLGKQANDFVDTCEANYLVQKSQFNAINDDIQSKKIKKTLSESSLYNGSIVNPKELQDLQKEIASHSAYISRSEEELLNKLIKLENCEKELSEAKENLRRKLSEFESQKALLNGERNQLIHFNESQIGKKDSVTLQLEPSILNTYNSLREAKNGIAVAKLLDDSCSSCGASLTASQCQQARSQAKLSYCPSCGRILYGS